jgi:hypothetical protein
VLFSHQTTSYSQIFFTHPLFVPAADIFFDFPSGCPNPCCTEDCEMIRFPRRGLEGAAVLPLKRGRARGSFRRVRAREMCNWIDCDVAFLEDAPPEAGGGGGGGGGGGAGGGEGSECSSTSTSGKGSADAARTTVRAQICSKCKLVKYCSAEHQHKDWEEHRRLCVKPAQLTENAEV